MQSARNSGTGAATEPSCTPEQPSDGDVAPPRPPDRSGRFAPAFAVGLVAAVVRVLWVVLASREPVGLADPLIYLDSAASIARGDGYTSLLGRPTAYYPPGYPFFVATVRWFADRVGQVDQTVLALGLVQAVLGGVAAAALVLAGDRLVGRPTRRISLGIVAGSILALWPNLVLHSALVLSESLFVAAFCVLLAALFTWVSAVSGTRPARSNRTRGVAVASVVVVSTAVCTLVRPQSVVLLVPAVVVTWMLCGMARRTVMSGAGLVVLGLVLAIGPWAVRNAVVMDAVVPMSTNTGDNLCIGFHDGATGSFELTDACATEGRYVDGPAVEVARDAELRSRTLRWIREHPGELPGLAVAKVVATFRVDDDGLAAWESFGADRHLSTSQRSTIRWISNLYYWFVGVLSLVGAAIAVRDGRVARRTGTIDAGTANAALTVAIAVTGILVPMMFFGDPRFKIGIVPCLALLAALTLDRLRTARPGAHRAVRSIADDATAAGPT